MKKQILKVSLVIILLTIFASSCDKTGSSSSSGGGGNATNLALTNANITGTWNVTGNSMAEFNSFTFNNNVDFSVEDAGGIFKTGSYTIVDTSKIAFDNGNTITMTTLTANNFNFSYKSAGVEYNISTDKKTQSGGQGTSTGDLDVKNGVIAIYEDGSATILLTDGAIITTEDGMHEIDYDGNQTFILELELDTFRTSGAMTFIGNLNPNCFGSYGEMTLLFPNGSIGFSASYEQGAFGGNNSSYMPDSELNVSPGEIIVYSQSGTNAYLIEYLINVGDYCDIERTLEGTFNGTFYYDVY